ncbi:MAG: S8 family serine peptidase [Thermoleophilia bacterium]|nr:S8 family serine peptidase [Thermoleophilia bacterium]
MRTRSGIAGLATLVAALCLAPAGAADAGKLRGGLDALVAGAAPTDPRVATLAGLQPGELAYFVVLSEPNDSLHAAALALRGARILRAYRSVNAFALASTPASVLDVAALPWVRWLTPVEAVTVLGHEPPGDQSRATTGDVGAQPWWSAGITGARVRVAVLDTGLDPLHADFDDLDFRHWSSLLPNPGKVVGSRNFLAGTCALGTQDGHGHGTHVAGIATGTGEGVPVESADDGRYAGVAPDAELAVAKVLTDAGAGINSDLVAALEWAALPAGTGPLGCESVGADVVNLSLGSESRPTRLNSGSDVDFVSYVANRLAVRFGTTIVAAVGNSGPYVGSALESPGSAAQVLSVAAAAKDYDVNHDDTLSGDICAGWLPTRAECASGSGAQPPSISSFSSRGPTGDLWLKPDLAAPGYNIVAPQAVEGVAITQNDLNRGTRADPLYATATGTSMASPATAGVAALMLQAYRTQHGASPVGSSGVTGLPARSHALVRAALMNTAETGLYESRWMLTVDGSTSTSCPAPELDVLLFGFCSLGVQIIDLFLGTLTLYEARNRGADPFVGPLAQGAGKVHVTRAIQALRSGIVAYSAASGSGDAAGTGPRDLQGSWQLGVLPAGSSLSQRFVLHAAPGQGPHTVRFAFQSGRPSDTSRPITTGKGGWTIRLPARASVPKGGDALVTFTATAPAGAVPGSYSGTVVATVSNGQVLEIPVFASVPLHDANRVAGVSSGAQSSVASALDVFAKGDTVWPSAAGSAGTGSSADWLVYPVELAAGLSAARFSVHAVSPSDETYDLYIYDADLDLDATTHPFSQPGVTDLSANAERGSTPSGAPQILTLPSPAPGRYYVAVSRAKLGGGGAGSFGSFLLRLDERG